ncbi:hypothetical protein [Candidatus Solirubrobacter pratensis]|uniref:hypothetical protein n=1 Tax=Candidatus Solirubrobacter pratensis TaxID=1298857 RepID=UPI0018CA3E37|nr:hypothetical protein [Candidatus Solirubrobacter pratensis]
MDEDTGGLQSGLKRRHVMMISLGGVIGVNAIVLTAVLSCLNAPGSTSPRG